MKREREREKKREKENQNEMWYFVLLFSMYEMSA
jgi:hypothetical protein